MQNMKEALQVRAELALWATKKEVHRLRVDELKKKLISEQNDVERMERDGFFSRIKSLGRFDEKLEKEKAEAEEARTELERVETLLLDADKKIPFLEKKVKKFKIDGMDIDKAALSEMEKELLDWCEMMELAEKVIALNNHCIKEGTAALLCTYSGSGNREKNLEFQQDVNMLMQKTEEFLSKIGRVRYLPGMRLKTIQGVKRNSALNGRTLLFFWAEHKSTEIDILDFDFQELWGSWAVGDTMERKLKELKELEQLFYSIAEEKMVLGEEFLRKLRCESFISSEKNLFGFESGWNKN